MDIVSALVACAAGCVISFAEFLLSKYFLLKKEKYFSSVTIIRQFLSIAFLVALYFIGQKTSLNAMYLLVGGAIGITVPSFIFTARLVKANSEASKKKEDENG